jgi:hypothetical protein
VGRPLGLQVASLLFHSLGPGLTCILIIVNGVNIPFDKLHLLNRTIDDLWKLTPVGGV